MRRKDREITDYNKMLEILHQCDCCRLGFIDDIGTYIVPLNFGYEELNANLVLYFHGAREGKKLDLIKTQNQVGFEMDRKHELIEGNIPCAYSFKYQSIIGKGKIEILENFSLGLSLGNEVVNFFLVIFLRNSLISSSVLFIR